MTDYIPIGSADLTSSTTSKGTEFTVRLLMTGDYDPATTGAVHFVIRLFFNDDDVSNAHQQQIENGHVPDTQRHIKGNAATMGTSATTNGDPYRIGPLVYFPLKGKGFDNLGQPRFFYAIAYKKQGSNGNGTGRFMSVAYWEDKSYSSISVK